ncbi:hypothetical protein [Bacillus safensis]|uniref:hypothetical protein n=1 Tax=Bacillus safensis TaxID=561879 RepID=UPI0003FB4563|nr:hypothetical protein [Bacillus safensis]
MSCIEIMKEINGILQQGIINRIVTNDSVNVQTNLIEWFKKASYEEVRREVARGFKLNFTLPIVGELTPFDFGASDSEQKFNELKSYINQGKVTRMSIASTRNFLSENIDANTVAAWERSIARAMSVCTLEQLTTIQTNASDTGTSDTGTSDGDTHQPPPPPFNYGLRYTIDNSDGNTVIKILYHPQNRNDTYPKVESFSVIGGECIQGALTAGESIDNEKTIILKQTSSDSALLLISTDKQDLDIKFSTNVLNTLLMKIFVYKIPINPFQHIYTQKVPEGYKIIGAGFNLGFGNGNVANKPNIIPTSSYPLSNNEWSVKFSSKIENQSEQNLFLALTTVYDPHNTWDIKIFSNKQRNVSKVSSSPNEDFILVGGGCNFNVIGANDSSDYFNMEDFRVGLRSLYPKNSSTWEVSLGESDIQRVGNWELTCYSIGIKNNGNIENFVKQENSKNNAYLSDGIYYTSSGGGVLNEADRNKSISVNIHYFKSIGGGTATDQSTPIGWFCSSSNGMLSSELNTYALGIRHSGIQFLPIEFKY